MHGSWRLFVRVRRSGAGLDPGLSVRGGGSVWALSKLPFVMVEKTSMAFTGLLGILSSILQTALLKRLA